MKTKSIHAGTVIFSLCEIVIGILLLINPVGFTRGIVAALGVILVIAGVVCLVRYFKADPVEAALEQNLTRGLIACVIGVFCIVKNEWFVVTFPVLTVIYGVIMLVAGIEKIQWTVDLLRAGVRKWLWVALDAVLTILCAAIILFNPFSTTAVLWTFVAIALIVEAVADILVAIFAKRDGKKEA